jgi:ABC-type Zn2+ transport system substrate-binding protein/surface adhesin
VPGSEPPARHLEALLAELRAPEPAALFSEPQFESQLATTLAREAGVVLHPIDPIGGGPGADSYELVIRGIARAMDGALR